MWKRLVVGAMFLAASDPAGRPADDNWRLHGGAQNDQRFSPLDTDQRANRRRQLGLAWSKRARHDPRISRRRHSSKTALSIRPAPGAWCSPSTRRPARRSGPTTPEFRRERAYFILLRRGEPRRGAAMTGRSSSARSTGA